MTRTLTLNDGSAYPVVRCGEAQGHLWITFAELSDTNEIREIFTDTEKTCVMTCAFDLDGAPVTEYRGFTRFDLMRQDLRGVTICMSRPSSNV